jgi:KDO2-lipid IV(A) lauroyltransferase
MRKRTLNNLSLASDLRLEGKALYCIAKQSLENLMITCLEYAKFASLNSIEGIIRCENPENAAALMQQGTPVIFFCGHQANWEVLFLEGTSRMPGVAIGRPIKNRILYQWLLSIREKFGGKMIAPQNAVREGLRALKKGAFLGIVGDQGMPDSGFCSSFLGKRAWTSPLPAILAYRTGSPIIVATTRRVEGKYLIHYSDPIWPNKTAPMEKEVERMMKEGLSLLEESIKREPGQWLWSHNRWKQQTPHKIKRAFRQESLCVILPPEKEAFDTYNAHLATLRAIYPLEFITCKVPEKFAEQCALKDALIETYTTLEDLLVPDFRFKLVFNFTPFLQLRAHYLKYTAFDVLDIAQLQRLAQNQSGDLSFLLNQALLKSS